MNRLSTAQHVALVTAAVLYAVAGSLHFIKTGAYVKIMPPFIPGPVAMVYISGAFEILGGLGLLVPSVRRLAAWGLAALLVAVFPANIYMAVSPLRAGASSVPPLLLWGRLPLQFVLIWWVLWCSRPLRRTDKA